MAAVAWTALILSAVLALSACGGGADEAAPTPTVPPGFEVPAGVTLTEPGSTVKVGQSATFVYELRDGVASAVTATVDAIEQGSIAEDFAFFTLDEETEASTPYYVTVSLTNEGPAGLGGAAVPFVVHDDQNTIAPPNTVTGTFPPCENRELPESFLPGEEATVCLVFLVPEGRALVSIDSRSKDTSRAISWTP